MAGCKCQGKGVHRLDARWKPPLPVALAKGEAEEEEDSSKARGREAECRVSLLLAARRRLWAHGLSVAAWLQMLLDRLWGKLWACALSKIAKERCKYLNIGVSIVGDVVDAID